MDKKLLVKRGVKFQNFQSSHTANVPNAAKGSAVSSNASPKPNVASHKSALHTEAGARRNMAAVISSPYTKDDCSASTSVASP